MQGNVGVLSVPATDQTENTTSEPEVTVPLCGKCDQQQPDLFFCDTCNVYLCENDWNLWDSHRMAMKMNKSASHVKVPRSTNELVMDWDASIFQEPDQTKQENPHEKNLPTFWFGMDVKESKALINTNLYADIILSSEYHPHSVQFPSLVSLIGTTGAGKSTLGKALINLHVRSEERHHIGPLPGLQGVIKPTSSGVHLYYDPQTLHSARPLLFADCEGLDGGDSDPLGYIINRAYGIARKILPWKRPSSDSGEEPESLTRTFCVNHIYPRILYAFSDILCFVIQQNGRVIEKCATQMIQWAENVHEKSLNQAVLPRAIVAFNNCGQESEWIDENVATSRVLDHMAACTNLGSDLRKIADKWNHILPDNEKVNSVKDLVLRYFKSVSVVYVPPRKEGGLKFHSQIQQLRNRILSTSEEIHKERCNTGGQINAVKLEAYLNGALDHFFTNFDQPFDFSKYARANEPLSASLSEHAISLLREMNKLDANSKKLDERAAKLFSSYLTFAIIPKDQSQVYSSLKDSEYIEPYRAAYESFYQTSHCWFRRNGQRCQNEKNGHAHGHQNASGSFIASGDYQTPYTEDGRQKFLHDLEGKCLASLTRLRETRNAEVNTSAKQHSTALQQERQLLMGLTSRKTCYFCLADSPDFKLDCQHNICSACVKRFGRRKADTSTYILSQCLICEETESNIEFQLKPTEAGVRVLTIDGGGVRGTISARMLQLLEDEIGLGLPIFHFFDLILGTSSGGIISLGIGVNRWSAKVCVEKFKSLAEEAFKARWLTGVPLIGFFVSFLRDSHYQEEALEDTLKTAFRGADGPKRLLFEETLLSSTRDSTGKTRSARYTDLKVGVTAVHATTQETCIMSNYNRKNSKEVAPTTRIYREEDREMEIQVWQAARCTSAAPSIFPIYTTPNGHSFHDGGLNENNPLRLAIKEARLAWSDSPNVDLAVSVGSGHADNRIADENAIYGNVVHGWLKRCIDNFDKKCDPELQWNEYNSGLDKEQKERHHRLDVKLSGLLVDMCDTSRIEDVDKETVSFFKHKKEHQQLKYAARHALAVLFYSVQEECIRMSQGHFKMGFRILCRLEEEHQLKLMARLQDSGCHFQIQSKTADIDFGHQQTMLRNGSSFQQSISWETSDPSQKVRICLVFGGDIERETSGEVVGIAQSTRTTYDISGSPFTKSLLNAASPV